MVHGHLSYLHCLTLLLFVCTSCRLQAGQTNAVSSSTLAPLDVPFLFAYGTWEKRAVMGGGRIVLRGDGLTPKGGAGVNIMADLSGNENRSPALRVRTGAANQLHTLRLMLRDTDGHVGTWNFALPASSPSFAVVTPNEGASLARPNALDKPGQNVELHHIMQWQLTGDYSGDGAVDVEINGLLLVAPDAALLVQRKVRDAQMAGEQDKRRQEQDALKTKYKAGLPSSPVVESAGLVAPDILALTIQAGHVVPGSLTAYQPQPNDKQRPKDRQVILARKGVEFGWLIGAKRDHLVAFERLEGDPLLDFVADLPDTYAIRSQDDSNFSADIKPLQVWRKSKPTDWAQPGLGLAMRHIVYLKAPHSFVPGKTYTVRFPALNTQKSELVFKCDPGHVRSEAIHIQQIGFRPDDPAKRAFLSVWLGTGGAYHYPDSMRFSLREASSGKSVYTGKVVLTRAASEPEAMWKSQNFNLTDVYRMDFADFTNPGTYRVCVEGVGCSYPFEIGNATWRKAFTTQMAGLYNERSGVELGPPYTQFRKPRDFYPADGVRVTQSTYSRLSKGGEAFADLAQGDTGKPVPDAWGGYHDAGDWNPRRITHMRVTHAQLELLELFPAQMNKLRLNIPPTPGLPDVLTEALFELDCFRRLQKPDGSVPFGIETNGDPIDGEVSWMQSMPAYVFAPDMDSSYYYAGVAARTARLLQNYDAAKAKTYQASALRAMLWAETQFPDRAKTDADFDKKHWETRDNRNFAALQLYALTGERKWHDVFLQNTCLKDATPNVFAWGDHVQRDAAFAYARLDNKLADANIKRNARQAVLSEADKSLAYASGNAFNLTTPDRGKPMFIGFYTAPDAIEAARAHFLTGETKYLAGAISACQFGLGGNPGNIVYTTGLGANPILHPLHLDSRRTGQPAPPGLTPYGNIDYSQWHDNFTTWPLTYYLNALCTPAPMEWPTTEAYFDIFLYPAQTEFTVDNWTPNVFVWGYLAARP